MAEPIKISTGKYKKAGKVEIDGSLWDVKLPGAATDLRISQQQRRLDYLEKRVETGKATLEDIDKCDELEVALYRELKNMFDDGSEDNASVVKWIDETPLAVILQVVEDIKEQANGPKDPPAST